MKYLEMWLIVEWKNELAFELWLPPIVISYGRAWQRELTACRVLTSNQRSCRNSEWGRISIFRLVKLKIWCGPLQIAGRQMPASTTTVLSKFIVPALVLFLGRRRFVRRGPWTSGKLPGVAWDTRDLPSFLPSYLWGQENCYAQGILTFRGHWPSSTSCRWLHQQERATGSLLSFCLLVSWNNQCRAQCWLVVDLKYGYDIHTNPWGWLAGFPSQCRSVFRWFHCVYVEQPCWHWWPL